MPGKLLFTALCSLVLLSGAVPPPSSSLPYTITAATDRLAQIDEIIERALATFQVSGVAIGVVVDGQVILSKGYGLRNREENLPVTENTLFPIASCTKAFTTTVLAQLVEEGKIKWDDPVIKHIPDFALQDLHATRFVTIRDLAVHRSGLPRHDAVWFLNPSLSREELLLRLKYLEPFSDLREKFEYSNLMYIMLGVLIERVTGKTWEENVRSRILTPLGMERSNFSVHDSQNDSDFSLPYAELGGEVNPIPFYDLSVEGPGGSINSSITDMLKWVQFQLAEGGNLLKKESVREMQTTQIATSTFPSNAYYELGYGLGWFTSVYKNHYILRHEGSIQGFKSKVVLCPQEQIGIVAICNSYGAGAYLIPTIVNSICDELLGVPKEDWLGRISEKRAKDILKSSEQKKKNSLVLESGPARPLTDYVGKYTHPAYGTLDISIEGERLISKQNESPYKTSLDHRTSDLFSGTLEHPVYAETWSFSFLSDPTGKISELLVPFDPSVKPIAFKRLH